MIVGDEGAGLAEQSSLSFNGTCCRMRRRNGTVLWPLVNGLTDEVSQ